MIDALKKLGGGLISPNEFAFNINSHNNNHNNNSIIKENEFEKRYSSMKLDKIREFLTATEKINDTMIEANIKAQSDKIELNTNEDILNLITPIYNSILELIKLKDKDTKILIIFNKEYYNLINSWNDMSQTKGSPEIMGQKMQIVKDNVELLINAITSELESI